MASPSVSGGHWQDFSAPVTLTADQAGAIYRAITSVTATLGLAANHLTLLAADRKDLTVLSANDMEALLAGALQRTWRGRNWRGCTAEGVSAALPMTDPPMWRVGRWWRRARRPDCLDMATPWLHEAKKQKASPREAGLSA